MKVIRLSALRTGRFHPPGNIPGTRFCYRLSLPKSHSAARRVMSMKNSATDVKFGKLYFNFALLMFHVVLATVC
jgi:hypothetical protein